MNAPCRMIPGPNCDTSYHNPDCRCAEGMYLPTLECHCDANVPHCRQCGQPMRRGVLDTQAPGPNRRYWICDPCDRAALHIDPQQDARVLQKVAI